MRVPVVLLGLAGVGLLAAGRMRVRPSRPARRSRAHIEGYYEAMLKTLARRGFVRGPAATPREFAVSLQSRCGRQRSGSPVRLKRSAMGTGRVMRPQKRRVRRL